MYEDPIAKFNESSKNRFKIELRFSSGEKIVDPVNSKQTRFTKQERFYSEGDDAKLRTSESSPALGRLSATSNTLSLQNTQRKWSGEYESIGHFDETNGEKVNSL